MKPRFAREPLDNLISDTIRHVARIAGGDVPHATIRDWCKRWLVLKAVEAGPSVSFSRVQAFEGQWIVVKSNGRGREGAWESAFEEIQSTTELP